MRLGTCNLVAGHLFEISREAGFINPSFLVAEKAKVEKRSKGVRIPKQNLGIIFSCKNVTMRENGRMGN